MNEYRPKFISKNQLKVFDIDPFKLRGKNFFKTTFQYRKFIFNKEKYRIKSKKNFFCNLCGFKKGKLFLSWKKKYQLIKCKKCEAVSPNISFKDEKKFIKAIYKNKDYIKKTFRYLYKNYSYRKKKFGSERYEYCLKRLKLGKKAKVLDLGCGMAYFVNYLNSKKIYAKGLEPNEAVADFCKTNLKLNVSSNNLLDEKNSEYDLITLFDVLEHLKNPAYYLKIINKKLKKNGYCVMYTPNIHSFAYALMGSNMQGILPFEHICFFNDKSTKYLAKKSNFKIHSIDTYGLDIMDYMLFKEFDDNKKYALTFKQMTELLQSILDKNRLSNHMRITFQKK